MALSEDQNFTLHFDFWDHLSIFRGEITHKIEILKFENNSQATSKQVQKQLLKSPENRFFELENFQNEPLQEQKFDEEFYFRRHISTF